VPGVQGPADEPEPGDDDWRHFLGPALDGSVPGVTVEPWGDGGPVEVWRRDVGAGYAGVVVAGERLLLFHRVGDDEVLEALDANTGESLWDVKYPTSYRDDFGFGEGPRSAPTVADGRVYSFGAEGILQAVSLYSGRVVWRADTRRLFDVPKGYFGTAGSPLVVGDLLLLNVGGAEGAGIVGIDIDTGFERWRATSDPASYSSPVLAEIDGKQRALFFTRTGLVDVDPEDGSVRAQMRWRSRSQASVNAVSPLVIDGRVFLSACYGTGAVLLDVEGNEYTEVWSAERALDTHYATAIHHDGVLYGFDGALHLGPPNLRAVDLETGEVLWSVDQYGGGAILRAGDRLLIQRDNGELVLADTSRDGYRPLASAQLLEGEVRAYPAFAHALWYTRNESELIAVRLQ